MASMRPVSALHRWKRCWRVLPPTLWLSLEKPANAVFMQFRGLLRVATLITHIPPINRFTLWWRESGGRDWLRTRSKPQLRSMLVDFREAIDMVKAIQSEFQLRPDDQ